MLLEKFKSMEGRRDMVNYIAVFGLIGVSGLPYFYTSQTNIFILFIFSFYVFLKRSITFNPKVFSVMIAFYVVDILQMIFIKSLVPMTLVGTYVRLFVCFFIVSICDKKFTRYYSNVIYFLAIVSLIFYLPSVISTRFYNLFVDRICPLFNPPFAQIDEFYVRSPSIILFTFHPVIVNFRNPGPFWEPGAFAIFLIIAIMFNVINDRILWTKKNILLSVVLLTTLSTSGFIAFFIAVLSYYLVTGNVLRNTFILAIFLPIGISLYFTLDFLSAKIENNISIADDDKTSRFGSGLADLKDFSTSPIIGWGKGAMRYGGKEYTFFTEEQHRNNGLTEVLAAYGIVIFFVLFYNYYKSLRTLCIVNSFNEKFAVLALLVIMLLGFSQTVFQYPFFQSLMFIHLMYTKNNRGLQVIKTNQ